MKNKKIDAKDITSSPYFVAALMFIANALAVLALVFFVLEINDTKAELVSVRQAYNDNVKEYAALEELKARSEAAEKQLEECKGILPDSLGDVYILQEDVLAKCEGFGLDVLSIDFTTVTNETQEVVFTVNASGTFTQIYNMMNYYSNLEQQHRFDSISLTKDPSTDIYSATFALAILSEQGVEGVEASVEETTVAS